MPGRLVMEQEAAPGSPGRKRKRSHAEMTAPEVKEPVPVQNGSIQAHVPTSHASNGDLPNGVPANPDQRTATTNGDSAHNATATASVSNGPPPLDQSWRQSEQYKSLGLLMERTAQQCYHDLNKTLDEMSSIPVDPQQPQQPNGIGSHSAPDPSEASLQKKRLLLDFASNQRDRFTKVIVLSDWCKNGEDKARIIDVKVWQDKQRMAYEGAEGAIVNTKAALRNGAKMPNPNIDGAMEVLATGKASWVPDLGYIPPKRLTARQLLKTLREMNSILATRIMLNEELPAYFTDYTIADGRATFKVKDEFEVDLAVADEDPASPFYFIDIRLSFNPAPSVLAEQVRSYLDGKINHELATKGLQGCYDFLHNFVLTHKITLLKDQAQSLVKDRWFECIKMEHLRRSLVVQYWAGVPGPKSWIEIGVGSGKQEAAKTRRPATPSIVVRHFQDGVEVKDEPSRLDWSDVSLQNVLVQAIKRHTTKILNGLQERLQGLAPPGSRFIAKIVDGTVPDGNQELSLSLPSLKQSISIRIDPVTGRFSITPPSLSTLHAERRINEKSTAYIARRLASLMCTLVQEKTRREADLLDWTAPVLARQDNLGALFGRDLQLFSVFRPSGKWDDKWALAVTFSLGGEKWWVVQLEERQGQDVPGGAKIITSARAFDMDESAESRAVSSQSLLRVQKLVYADVSENKSAGDALGTAAQNKILKQVAEDADEVASRHTSIDFRTYFLSFSKLMQRSQDKSWRPWADDLVRLTHSYGRIVDGKTRWELRLSLKNDSLTAVRKYFTSKSHSIRIRPSGSLGLRCMTPFAHSCIGEMRERLRTVERLDRYATILKQVQWPCTHLSLSRLSFDYCKAPHLSAELIFPTANEGATQLHLHPSDSNPHQRVRIMLEAAFNRNGENGFLGLVSILTMTLPLLQALGRLEAKSLADRSISVHARGTTEFRIVYRAPLPRCMFDVWAKTRIENGQRKAQWLIGALRPVEAKQKLSDELSQSMKALSQESGEFWQGLGNGIVADGRGVAEVLEKVDAIIRDSPAGQIEPKLEENSQPSQQPAPAQPSAPASNTAQVKAERQAPKPPTSNKPAKQEHEVITLD